MTQFRPFYTAQSLWSDFRVGSHWTVQETELLGDKEAMVSMEPEKQLLTIEVLLHYII